MNNYEHLKGSCACGKVIYEITDKPLFTQACHCKNCKISTGSSYVIHTMIFEDDLIVDGSVSGSTSSASCRHPAPPSKDNPGPHPDHRRAGCSDNPSCSPRRG